MLKAALTRALAAPLVTAIVALPLVVVTTIVATPEVASAGPPCPAGTHAEQTTWGPTGINWPRPGNNQSSGTSETYVDELTPDVDVTFSISDPNNNNADADNPYQAAYGGMFGWDNVNGVTTQVNGAYGAGYLTLGMNSIRTTDHVTFTFDYESPVLIPNFSIGDIDGVGYGNSPAEEPHESYQDRLTFAAERDGQNVPLTLTPLGGATPVVSGQTAQANYVPGVNGNLNPGDAAGTIEVTVMEPITRFSFRYSNGPDDAAADQAAGVPPAPLPADANSISNSHAVRVNFFTVCVGNVDLGDTVFFDLDGDGVRDPSDPPAPGVTVELRDPSGNVIETAVTDSNGNYLFENLPPYDWTVTVDQSTLPTGSVPTV
ncbi:MAG: carboxypeptidase regulatory-like domain-containing protein, partial [Acidimicrobiales bacterium]|nr:carboxypeptidase regulatory-like domain-containing protein [Acidimicrobiales bacterium]